MPWIVTSQIKIYVFVFVSEEIHWIVEVTESEPHSDNCATRLGVWWSWGKTLQLWECGGLGVRLCRSGVWWSWCETVWKTGSMVILRWGTAGLGVWWSWGETLQDWEYGGLRARILIQSVLSLIFLCPYFCFW